MRHSASMSKVLGDIRCLSFLWNMHDFVKEMFPKITPSTEYLIAKTFYLH